jgi:hypothetical protein
LVSRTTESTRRFTPLNRFSSILPGGPYRPGRIPRDDCGCVTVISPDGLLRQRESTHGEGSGRVPRALDNTLSHSRGARRRPPRQFLIRPEPTQHELSAVGSHYRNISLVSGAAPRDSCEGLTRRGSPNRILWIDQAQKFAGVRRLGRFSRHSTAVSYEFELCGLKQRRRRLTGASDDFTCAD